MDRKEVADFFASLKEGNPLNDIEFLRTGSLVATRVESASAALHCVLSQCTQTNVPATVSTIALLLHHGADVNWKDSSGNIFLHRAIEHFLVQESEEVIPLIQLLVNRGADVNAKSNGGHTPLQQVFCGFIQQSGTKPGSNSDPSVLATLPSMEFEQCLVASSVKTDPMPRARTTTVAQRKVRWSLVKLLLDHQADLNVADCLGNTALHQAAMLGDAKLLKLLLDHHADIKAVNNAGDTALHTACLAESTKETDFVALVKLLLDHGLNPSVPNTISGSTPLHAVVHAAGLDKIPLLWLLVQRKANVNAVDHLQRSPLHIAVLTGTNVEIVGLLLLYQAKINVQDHLGLTPLYVALSAPRTDYSTLFELMEALLNGKTIFNEDGGTSALHMALLNLPNTACPMEHILSIVQLLLDHKAGVNIKDEDGNTPLHVTVTNCKNAELVKLLVTAKADVNAKDALGNTPFHTACLSFCENSDPTVTTEDFIKLVQPLVDKGTDVLLKNLAGKTVLHGIFFPIDDDYSRTNLLFLANWLLDHRPDLINVQDANGFTIAHLAAFECDLELTRLILAHKPDLNVKNTLGDTPLNLACNCYDAKNRCSCCGARNMDEGQLVQMVQLLVGGGADVAAENEKGSTALHSVLRQRESFTPEVLVSLVSLLFKYQPYDSYTTATPLHLLAPNLPGDIKIARLLLDHQARVNAKTALGNTPLYEVINFYDDDTRQEDFLQMVRLLVDRDTDLSAKNTKGRTVLHLAVLKRKDYPQKHTLALIQLLLNRQADVNARDADGDTCLHLAARISPYDLELMTLLLDYKADVNAKNKKGNTPLYTAIASYEKGHDAGKLMELVELFIKWGSDASTRNRQGSTLLHVSVCKKNAFQAKGILLPLITLLLENQADANFQNSYGDTLLHILVRCAPYLLDIVKLLLKYQVDVNLKNSSGNTPLHEILEWYTVRKGADFLETVKSLLEAGADATMRDRNGRTALHLAIRKKNKFARGGVSLLLVGLLLEHQAGKDLPDGKGDSPLHLLAKTCMDAEMAKLLLSFHADANAPNRLGNTPLLEAIKSYQGNDGDGEPVNFLNLVQVLLEGGADASIKDRNGSTPLHLVVARGSKFKEGDVLVPLVKLLLEHGAGVNLENQDGDTALHVVARTSRDLQITALLLKHNVDVNAKNRLGNTPLYEAILTYDSEDDDEESEDEDDEGEYAEDEDEEVDGENDEDDEDEEDDEEEQEDDDEEEEEDDEDSVVVEVNFLDWARLLLEGGADASSKNSNGWTPLRRAMLTTNLYEQRDFYIALMKLLIEHQALERITTDDGSTFLHLAIRDLAVVELLLDHRVNANVRDKLGNTPLHTFFGYYHEHDDEDLFEIVQLLLDRGADVSLTNNFGSTVLHEAVKYNIEAVSVKLLLDHKADVNARDMNGDTPLAIAVGQGNLERVTMLMERGADMNIQNGNQSTPFILACSNGRLPLIYQLIRLSPHHLRPRIRHPFPPVE